VSILSKTILQILHRCCFTFLEVEGADADIGVFLNIYVAIIVKFYVCCHTHEIRDTCTEATPHVLNKFIGLKSYPVKAVCNERNSKTVPQSTISIDKLYV
jgi:hypothetical protein